MTQPRAFDLDSMLPRMWRFLWILAAVGTVVVAGWRGFTSGWSFLTGAVISALLLSATCRVVMAIGAQGPPKRVALKSVLLGSRWLLVGGVLYVMIKFLGLQIADACFGMLVAAGAAILEILYELVHRT